MDSKTTVTPTDARVLFLYSVKGIEKLVCYLREVFCGKKPRQLKSTGLYSEVCDPHFLCLRSSVNSTEDYLKNHYQNALNTRTDGACLC